ncbi:MAG: phosphoglucosamine mutase [Verrucomicrobiota bacterium]|nr:phosphoglucosamine mutase [Verrucomicrobiota bacterium]
MGKLFGTDGIRGKVNAYPITPEVALKTGKAIAHVFGAAGHGSKKTIIGKDTRLSGYMLETALTSGLVSMGMDVLLVGPIPTPAIAHLTKSMGAAAGIMITASHNPAEDNGIKIFNHQGYKLDDDIEHAIEESILGDDISSCHIENDKIGKAYRIDDATGRYIEFAKNSISNLSLQGMKIVLDCANGGAYHVAPQIFKELGAETEAVGINPDGYNINLNCGALYLNNLCKRVTQSGADLGIAFDGDADRVIFSDNAGNIIDGDSIIAICALALMKKNKLKKKTVVVTSMTNLGFHKLMHQNKIKVETTAIGDRYIIEKMRKNNYSLGGEQSGHIILSEYGTTGDGIITALQILKIMKERKTTLKELGSSLTLYPQKLINLTVKEKKPIEKIPAITNILQECKKDLADEGRYLIRYSGTENKIRILLEAKQQQMVDLWSNKIAQIIKSELE